MKFSKLENLSRKTKSILYNGGSLIPNGTISNPIEPEWKYFALAVGTVEGKDRIAFFVRNIFSYNNDVLRFQGVELRYNTTNQTLKVVNNGGNLYFVEQYSTLT